MVTPRLTTDPELLADDSFQQRKISMKDVPSPFSHSWIEAYHFLQKVFSVQDRIYEAFCKYERNEISSEIFLDILNVLDLQPSTAVIKVSSLFQLSPFVITYNLLSLRPLPIP
jgi:hypothetical protein